MKIDKLKGGWIFHAEISDTKMQLSPCPFCGESEKLELNNTHTPSYWIQCLCSAHIKKWSGKHSSNQWRRVARIHVKKETRRRRHEDKRKLKEEIDL